MNFSERMRLARIKVFMEGFRHAMAGGDDDGLNGVRFSAGYRFGRLEACNCRAFNAWIKGLPA